MKKPTIKLGTKFRYSYADGNPMWEVIQARGRGTWICRVLPDEPDWAGQEKCYSTEEIQKAIAFENYWKQSGEDSEAFYKGLKEGQIVHYHNSFGAFVRCKVTKSKKLVRIALVGNWNKFDLPRRNVDGTIDFGYHTKQVRAGEVFQPHASNVWECNPNNYPDPRNLPEINLEVPEMTPEEKVQAAKWQKLNQIRDLVNGECENPDDLFRKLLKALL